MNLAEYGVLKPHRRPKWLRLKAQVYGYSLVEVLIAVSVMGVIGAGVSGIMSSISQNQRLVEIISARDGLSARLTQAVHTTTSILTSARNISSNGNRSLSGCVNATGCNVTGPVGQEYFDLWEGSSAGPPSRVAGTEANPVYYGIRGERNCDPAKNPTCIFAAVASFWGACGGGQPTCVEAQTIYVRTQVRVLAKPQGRTVQNGPPDADFNGDPASFAIPILLADIKALEPTFCPNGTMLKGLESLNNTTVASGKSVRAICICPPNTIQVSSAPLTCAYPADTAKCQFPNVVLIGLNALGGPVCATREEAVSCSGPRNFTMGNSCGEYQWLKSLQVGRCWAEGGEKKGDPPRFLCVPTMGVCCRFKKP